MDTWLLLNRYILPILVSSSGVIAILLCCAKPDKERIALSVMISVITWAAWTSLGYFDSPLIMGTIHLFAFLSLIPFIKNYISSEIMSALLLMVTADAFQGLYNLRLPEGLREDKQVLIYWHYAINIIYFYMCVIIAKGCIYKGSEMPDDGSSGSKGNAGFMASLTEDLHLR